jgi:ABC-2 type transport system permease protein
MMQLRRLLNLRLWTLIRKEATQSLRNPQMIVFLLVSPIFQLITFGVALNPEIHDIALGVVDDARSSESRELTAAFVENGVFAIDPGTRSFGELDRRLAEGKISAGLIIPVDFERYRARGRIQNVQILIDGVNAYTAGLTASYASEIVQAYGQRLHPLAETAVVRPDITFLYNPGLVSSWYFVPGIIGTLVTTLGVITLANEAVREKETGTLEQLMMTPASSIEVLAGKLAPSFVLIFAAFLFSVIVAHVLFSVPLRGDLLVLSLGTALYIVACMSIGLLFATVAQTTLQAILLSLFVTLPMTQLSGAVAPIDSMPPFFLTLSLFNPLRHYATILREVLVKGAGLAEVWPQLVFIGACALALLAVSSVRFRRQLR